MKPHPDYNLTVYLTERERYFVEMAIERERREIVFALETDIDAWGSDMRGAHARILASLESALRKVRNGKQG